MAEMIRYPILFGFRDLVAGSGFVATIATEGRALLTDEGEEGFWMYGVNPGGIAGSGDTPVEAQSDFRQRYKSVLFDIARVSGDFSQFKATVERFFYEVNKPTAKEWDEAVQGVREGKVRADWMLTGKADAPRHVEVVEVREPEAAVNALDEQPAIAA